MRLQCITILTVWASTWAGALPPPTPGPPPPCQRWAIEPRAPAYVTTAAWVGAELVVPSPRTGELLALTVPDTASAAPVELRSATVSGAAVPLEIRESGGRVWLLAAADDQAIKLFTLGRSLVASPVRTLTELAVSDTLRLMGATAVLPVGSDLYGMLYTWEGRRRSFEGLGRIELASEPVFSPYLPLPIGGPGRPLVESYPSIFAEAGGRVYALVYGTAPQLEEVSPGRRRVEAFPAEYRRLPPAPSRFDGLEAAWEFATATRGTPMVTALFGRGKLLYLLARSAAAPGASYALYRVDPARDTIEGPLELPSRASELVAAPGADRWAFLELGPMELDLSRPLVAVTSIPATLIEGPWPRSDEAHRPCGPGRGSP